MERRRFGLTDMHVSVLGFGGGEIGYEQAPAEAVVRLLNDALDAGLNVIDTAECYVDSEEKIGQAVGHRRSDFYLFTKVGHPEGMQSEDWRPESIQMSIERSLRRLRTDRVDLVQLHSCSEAVLRAGDAIEALKRARDRGQTRYIGYSGDGNAARYACECGQFDSLQTSVSIADQEAIDRVIPVAVERQMGVIAKRPLANAAWKSPDKPPSSYARPYWERLRRLDYDFLKGPDAVSIALRFTLAVPGVDTAIVGTTKPGRWRENAKLLESGPLPADQFEAIRARWEQVAGPDWVGQV